MSTDLGKAGSFNKKNFTIGNTSQPNSYQQDQPLIHNKLHCDQIQTKLTTTLRKLNAEELKHVKSHTQLAETANGVRMMAKSLSKITIQLDVRVIMIVTKARDNSLTYLTREVAEWLLTRNRDIVIYIDHKLQNSKRFDYADLTETYTKAQKNLKFWDKKSALQNPEIFDLVITLGGDGTVLYVSNLFQKVVPPVMSYSLGSLGFLTNFKFEQFREKMNHVIESGVKACLRMRFTCRVHRADGKLVCEQQVLNELVIDRGPSPFVTNLELYGDGSLLTVAQADGLIIATPTGSTAYSLSAGGSLVHPGVSAISVTPICPHTLSFRPILLPDGMFLKVKVPNDSRAIAWSSFDGRVRTELKRGDYVTVHASQYPFPTVISSKTEYIDSVSRNLHWNAREKQKSFTDYLSDDSKAKVKNYHMPSIHQEDFEDSSKEFDIDFSDEEGNEDELVAENKSEGSCDEVKYVPTNGTTTPHDFMNNDDDREVFAHPKAIISMDDQFQRLTTKE